MWKKSKQFFKLVKYETIRVSRNKVVFTMLFVFSVILLLALSFIQINTDSYPIAIFTDGVNIDKAGVVQLIEDNLKTSRITFVNSKEDGLDMIKKNSACFFICLDAGEEEDETTATFYYDQSNTVGRTVASSLAEAKNQYAYDTITEFLSRYGITLNETYFQLITFKPVSDNAITIRQMPFSIEVTCCASIILMLGVAYSLARDNETQVSKNTAYIPIGSNRYLLSKVIPYFLLGMIQMSIMYFLGIVFFKIDFQLNILLVILLSSFFVMSVILLGLLFSLFKSQISTIFLDMMAVLLPVFVSIVVYVQACPIFIQAILYCLPITPFISYLNCMIYNGVVLWWVIPIFIAQSIVYYLISLFIVKRRIKE